MNAIGYKAQHCHVITQSAKNFLGIYAISLAIGGLFALLTPAAAVDAVWLASPGSNDWNTAGNWNPPSAPVTSGSTATFGVFDGNVASALGRRLYQFNYLYPRC